MSDYIENKQSISSNYILHGPVYNGLSNETFDMVNHPKHYNVNGMEAIDVIKSFTDGLNGIEAVDTANIIKYILRWHRKNGVQDLEKAQWYLNHLINEIKNKDLINEIKNKGDIK